MTLHSLWEASFPDRSRPSLYSSEEQAEDGWLPISDADEFLVDSLASLDPAQLYTLTANNAEALQKAQQEWTHLEKLAQHLKTRDPFQVQYKDPQELPRQEIFEERKEAVLYNYRYEAHRRMLPARFTISENVTDQEKFDCREPPEPFSQGGFIPNEKQHKSLMLAAKSEGREKNPDNQKPYETNFAFEQRPVGQWVAKMSQPEAPPLPRTRAREAALNGGVNPSDRLTRFNGEKVPPTRGISMVMTDAPSPRSRVSTPVGGASPALKKRKIETVDVTGALPRKKHPNQYTKRREAEETARSPATQDTARLNGQPVAKQLDQNSPEFQQVKKKHPNQYTKRREREEAEGRARMGVERQIDQDFMQDKDDRIQEYEDAMENSYQQRFGPDRVYGRLFDPPRYFSPATGQEINPATGRSKHPNQYTKRREREEAERLAALQHANATAAGFVNSRSGTPSWLARPQAPPQNGYPPPNMSRTATPSQPPRPQQSRSTIDTSRMTKEELRTHLFKDTELIALLESDHSWLNDDPETAATWKAKILNSDYPVRTWAMLRKWKEWRAEGKDKRPRDKDGNRIREAVAAANANGTYADGDAEMADVESAAVSATGDTSLAIPTVSAPVPAPQFAGVPASSAVQAHPLPQSLAKRPTRLRTRAVGLDSSQPAPSSPLVNGVNARDLDTVRPPAPASLFFSSKLQSMDQLDSNAKVDSWQNQDQPQSQQQGESQTQLQTRIQTQTEYAANTRAGKGVLRQLPRLPIHGTEDERYPSSAELGVDIDVSASQAGKDKDVSASQELESEDPLHGHYGDEDEYEDNESHSADDSDDTSDSDRSNSPSTDPGEKDTEYRSGTRSRPWPNKNDTSTIVVASMNGTHIRGRSQPLRRTRSGMSTRSLLSDDAFNKTGVNTASNASARAVTGNNAFDTDSPRRTRTRSREQTQQMQQDPQGRISRTRTRDQQQQQDPQSSTSRTSIRSRDHQVHSEPRIERTLSPIAMAKRPGLRPNPPKRRLTGDSEGGANATLAVATRRSLRNAERGSNTNTRRESLGS